MTKANGQMSKEIYLAGGCFWGAEHFLKQIEGVEATEVGYANGHTDRPTYEEVCTDKTGFAETVRVVYDPARIGLAFLLNLYFKAIDPTSVNQQGATGAHSIARASTTSMRPTQPPSTKSWSTSSGPWASPSPWSISRCAISIPPRTTTRTTWRRTPRATAICLPPSSSWRARPSPSPPTTNAIQKSHQQQVKI